MSKRSTHFAALFVAFLYLINFRVHAQVITTIASGTTINDGQPALNAAFHGPIAVGFDKNGNTFILDADDYRVRKIDSNGIVTTLAGDGELGFAGDNGSALNARFLDPRGITADAAGNVYIADTQNHRIRKINTAGTITTITGTGTQGYSGDGGVAINAQVNYPKNVTIDKLGNLYIADSQNYRIRKIGVDGMISTVAGNGTSGYSGDGGLAINAQLFLPGAIAVDNAGNLYIADSNNNRIRKVDTNGIITTIAGNGTYQTTGDGGPAINAAVYLPVDIAVDDAGIVYVSQQDSRIRKISADGTILPVVGNGTDGFTGDGELAVNALIGPAVGIKIDNEGNLTIADRTNYRIRRIISDGVINTVAGGFTGDGGPATNAHFRRYLFNTPSNLTVDTKGNVYVVDRFQNRIRKVSPNGVITTIAGTGVNGYSGDGGPATEAQLRHPRGVGLDSTGNLYIVDQYNSRIRRVDTNNSITTIAGDGTPDFISPWPYISSASIYNSNGMAVTKAGTMYVPVSNSNCVLKITPEGIITIVAGTTASAGYSGDGGPAINAKLNFPVSVALDEAENLYIVDQSNNRIRKVDAAGIITTVVGNGSTGYGGENIVAANAPLNTPYEVAFDSNGSMYITESYYSRVRKVDRNGIMTTVAGSGTPGFSGDGGVATNARLSGPNGIVIDAAGNLYIADVGNKRVRKVTYPVQAALTTTSPVNCSTTLFTITAKPSGPGFAYQFSSGAAQIGSTNQAIVSTPGVYSVTVTTSIFGSPAGSATITIPDASTIYTVKAGNWDDPTIWSCGLIPVGGQKVRILHSVDVPLNYQAQASTINYETGGSLRFAVGSGVKLAP
ncbi:hypothetical protein GCM10028805_01770 [Spirosoma harenae]